MTSSIPNPSQDAPSRFLDEGLRAAIGTLLKSGGIGNHINPNDLGQADGRRAWIAVRIDLPNVGTGYFGLIWGGPMLTDPAACRAVSMIAPRRDRRDEVLLTAESISESVERWSGSAISLTGDLNSSESVFDLAQGPSVLERRLAETDRPLGSDCQLA